MLAGTSTKERIIFGAHGSKWLESMPIVAGSIIADRPAGVALEQRLRAHISVHM